MRQVAVGPPSGADASSHHAAANVSGAPITQAARAREPWCTATVVPTGVTAASVDRPTDGTRAAPPPAESEAGRTDAPKERAGCGMRGDRVVRGAAAQRPRARTRAVDPDPAPDRRDVHLERRARDPTSRVGPGEDPLLPRRLVWPKRLHDPVPGRYLDRDGRDLQLRGIRLGHPTE